MKVKILLMCILLLASCGRNYQRLNELDRIYSMGINYPADALKQLDSVRDFDSFNSSEKALYALAKSEFLLDCDSMPDSTKLNVAVQYFENNQEGKCKELYARALICSGRVDVLNRNFVAAVEKYRKVIGNLSEESDLSYGLANMYLAELYDKCSLRYGDIYGLCTIALKVFEQNNAKRCQALALSKLMFVTRSYSRTYSDSCWRKSMELSSELGDPYVLYKNKELMAMCCAFEDRPHEAKALALDCVNNGENYVGAGAYVALAMSYASLGNPDSARFWTSRVRTKWDDSCDPVFEMYAQSGVAYAQGDFKRAFDLLWQGEERIDSIEETEDVRKVSDVEISTRNKTTTAAKFKEKEWSALLYGSVIIVIVAVAAFIVMRRMHKKRVQELCDAFRSERRVSRCPDIDSGVVENEKIRRILEEHTALMNSLVKISCTESPERFAERFKELVYEDRNDEDVSLYWKTINEYVNNHYGKVVADVVDCTTNLSDKELKIVKLLCFGFSAADIAVQLQYSSPGSVRMTMSRLARKMGLADAQTLRDFIEEKRLGC